MDSLQKDVRSNWLFGVWMAFLLVFLVWVYWGPMEPIRFAVDDSANLDVVQIAGPATWGSLLSMWIPGRHIDYYPMRDLSYWLDFRLFSSEQGFHFHQLGLFLALTTLIVGLLIEVGAGVMGALAIGSLWAIHPLHAEMVIWLSARKDILALLWGAGSVWAWLRAVKSGPAASKRYSFIALLAYCASFLCKASLIGLPLIALLGLRIEGSVERKHDLRKTAFVALAFGGISAVFQAWFSAHVNPVQAAVTIAARIQSSAAALGQMWGGWFVPAWNVLDWRNFGQWLELHSQFIPLGWAAWTVFIVLLGISMKQGFRGKLALALTTVAVLYAPTSGLLFARSEFYSVRYGEPLFAATLLFMGAWLGPALQQFSAAWASGVILIVLALGLLTRSEANLWIHPLEVFAKGLKVAPESLSLKTISALELDKLHRREVRDSMLAAQAANARQELEKICLPRGSWELSARISCVDFLRWEIDQPDLSSETRHQVRSLLLPALDHIDPSQISSSSWRLAELLASEGNDPALMKEWEQLVQWKPSSYMRALHWAVVCYESGPAEAQSLLRGYYERGLLQRQHAEIFMRDQTHPSRRYTLRKCLERPTGLPGAS